jgi:hypothetical protein
MITFDCPFCDQAVGLEAEAEDARCDECGVVLELAPEATPVLMSAAA